MAAAVLTACSGGGTETKDSGQTVSETDGAGGGAVQEADSTTGSKDSVVVVMGPTSEPEAGFDPAYGWGAGEHVHEPLIQSTLTVTNSDLTIGYDLATSVESSEDGLTWTVAIRDDVSFTDGEPLTAEDVAFTYNTVKAENSVNDFTMLDYAEAADDGTVVFHMNRPYSIWPYTMAIVGIVPEHAYSPDYGQHPIGSGLLRRTAGDGPRHGAVYGGGRGVCSGHGRAGGRGLHLGLLRGAGDFRVRASVRGHRGQPGVQSAGRPLRRGETAGK